MRWATVPGMRYFWHRFRSVYAWFAFVSWLAGAAKASGGLVGAVVAASILSKSILSVVFNVLLPSPAICYPGIDGLLFRKL